MSKLDNQLPEDLEKDLLENTTGPAADGIETTDERLSVDQMFQQSTMPSIAKQIFSVLPIHGPTAALFNLQRKVGTNDIELVRNNVSVYPSTAIHTGMTKEVIQDIYAQYGKEAEVIIGKLLRGLANEQENTAALSFLTTNSIDDGLLTLSAPGNAATSLFELTQKIHNLILKINSKNLRSYNAFAVLPFTHAASFMALNKYAGSEDTGSRGLFITEVGQTKFYLNPDAISTTAYVGVKDIIDPTKSSAVFSPYTSTIIDTVNSDTGAETYHIYNRFAITTSPLHVVNNEMLYKFNIA